MLSRLLYFFRPKKKGNRTGGLRQLTPEFKAFLKTASVRVKSAALQMKMGPKEVFQIIMEDYKKRTGKSPYIDS